MFYWTGLGWVTAKTGDNKSEGKITYKKRSQFTEMQKPPNTLLVIPSPSLPPLIPPSALPTLTHKYEENILVRKRDPDIDDLRGLRSARSWES